MILNLCSSFLIFELLLCPQVPFSFQIVDVSLTCNQGEPGGAVVLAVPPWLHVLKNTTFF